MQEKRIYEKSFFCDFFQKLILKSGYRKARDNILCISL